ncbi:MAG: flavodoxin family protein [Methanobacteriaceae archaeon]|jgi:multimeric flavodoxin WrbA|nr:flavodoxin family protein [Candidatus Methanorudis spinitermitis]
MKIVGFSGSPRKNGSTNALIKRILKKAEDNDHDTSMCYLNDFNINPCQACDYCKENEGCDLDDDINELHKLLDNADYVIIGSPIYYGEVSAQTKLFTDRFYSIFNSKTKNFKGKKAILIYTQTNPDPKVYEAYSEHEKKYLYEFMDFDVVDILIAAGVNSKDDLFEKEEILNKADAIGMNI